MQASTLSSDDNPSPLAKTQQRKYHFGSRSPSGQSPVTKSRKAPQNLLVTSSPLLNPSCSDKETNSPKQKSTWKHFVTNQFKKMQPQNDSPTSNVNEGCTLSQCTPVSLSPAFMIDCFTTILFTFIFLHSIHVITLLLLVGREFLRATNSIKMHKDSRDERHVYCRNLSYTRQYGSYIEP